MASPCDVTGDGAFDLKSRCLTPRYRLRSAQVTLTRYCCNRILQALSPTSPYCFSRLLYSTSLD